MTRRLDLSAIAFAVVVAACGASRPATVPTTDTTVTDTTTAWTLAWSDEFDGPAGQLPDASKWTAEVGGSGWGNQEREYYTASATNGSLDGAGHLAITAVAEPANTALSCWYGPCRYTSARLITKGKFAQAYGRFEARIRIPKGPGTWPAFWLLGDDIDRVSWPQCGEIDVMEVIGRQPATLYGTIHGPNNANVGGTQIAPSGAWGDDYHVYSVEWAPGDIRLYADAVMYRRITGSQVPSGGWVFDHPFFVLLNFAVGGNWPGDPDATTVFPQQMLVDYVRVYRR